LPPVHRFFAPALDPGDEAVLLPKDEAEHLTRVLRLTIGDTVSVFDGRGHEFTARIVRARRDEVVAELVEPATPAREPAVPFTLVQAVLKGPAMDDAIRDAAMMGAAAIQPVLTAHTVVKVRPDAAERWQRVAIASAKQCRRATVPPLLAPSTLDRWLSSNDRTLTLMLVEPSAVAEPRSLRTLLGTPAPKDAALLVGPEGGWAREEILLALAAGSVPVTLGGLTLRADAVPIAAISVFRFLWE